MEKKRKKQAPKVFWNKEEVEKFLNFFLENKEEISKNVFLNL